MFVLREYPTVWVELRRPLQGCEPQVRPREGREGKLPHSGPLCPSPCLPGTVSSVPSQHAKAGVSPAFQLGKPGLRHYRLLGLLQRVGAAAELEPGRSCSRSCHLHKPRDPSGQVSALRLENVALPLPPHLYPLQPRTPQNLQDNPEGGGLAPLTLGPDSTHPPPPRLPESSPREAGVEEERAAGESRRHTPRGSDPHPLHGGSTPPAGDCAQPLSSDALENRPQRRGSSSLEGGPWPFLGGQAALRTGTPLPWSQPPFLEEDTSSQTRL